MRKLFLSLAAAAAVLTAGSIVSRADAAGPAPAGLNRAVADVAIVDRVHCVPGWRHHTPTRWRRANGCARYYRYGATTYPYVTTYPFWGYRTGFYRHHRVVRIQRHRHAHIHRSHRHYRR